MRGVAGRRVLILGGGIMQLPAVRAAVAMGWRVSVAARETVDEVAALCHRNLRVDLRDREAVEREARGLRDGEGLDGVFTAGTDFSTTVAWVAERLGLPGIPYERALEATDKARMRAAFDRRGVPSPRFFTVQAGSGAGRRLPAGFDFPLVVKPVDNMGARGVRRVDDPAELDGAVEGALRESPGGRAIVEEYLAGPELSLDAVVHAGRVTVCGVADRHIRFAPYFVEMGHTMPSALEPSVLRQAESAFRQGIAALGIREGTAKGDVKITSRGAVVGEIAARLSGGYMSGWTFPLASGVELTRAALRVAVGLAPGDLRPRRGWVSAERAFISIPGRVRALEGLEEARGLPRIAELFLRTAPGQEVNLPVNNLGKCGNLISAAPTREEAVQAAEEAVRRVLVRLQPGEARTEEFLAGRLQGQFWAFGGSEQEAAGGPLERWRAAAAALPAWSGDPAALGRPGGLALRLHPALLAEAGADWHGYTLQQAAARVAEIGKVRLLLEETGGAEGRVVLNGVFCRALLRGSVQGALYLLDTLRQSGASGEQALRRWEAWR